MTTKGANFQKVQRTGRNNNIITPEGSSNHNGGSTVAELSSHEDIQERDLNPDEDLVVEELEGGNARIRERREDERFIKVNLDSIASDRLEKFFEPETIEELERKSETIEGESKPKDIDEVWSEIREGVESHNREVAKNKRRLERERIKEAYRDPALDKKFKNMKGSEIQRVMSDDSSSTVDEEELQKSLAEVDKKYESMLNESEPEINDPSTEIDELDKGLEAWKDSDKEYWHDFVEDLEESDEETMYESVGPNSKRVTTQDSELKQALRDPENEPNWTGSVELEEDTGETVIAVVREE
ncbi:hypothetical protein [Halorubrum ezzemoulense]|uniref:hypothetical protein n=1 Tax=Halorubrum ezzemoulense TaxID=337243 RepID=UPI00111C0503|nr:hypothetical protein [Halorubrum ezzemoulense]